MAEERVQRRLAAILAGDVAGYSRLIGEDEEGTLARLKAHRRELVDPTIDRHAGRIVKTTGDGILVEFASIVDAVRCAVAIQRGMAERNADVPEQRRIEFRIGVHVGDIVIEDGDILGDGVNIAARLEGIAEPGGICISDDAARQVRGKLDVEFEDRGNQQLKNIAKPVRVYAIQLGGHRRHAARLARASRAARKAVDRRAAVRQHVGRAGAGLSRRRHRGIDHGGAVAHPLVLRHRAQLRFHLQGPPQERARHRPRARRRLCDRRQRAEGRQPPAHHGPDGRDGKRRSRLELSATTARWTTSSIFRTASPSNLRARSSLRSASPRSSAPAASGPQDLGAYDYTMRAMPHVWALEKEEAAEGAGAARKGARGRSRLSAGAVARRLVPRPALGLQLGRRSQPSPGQGSLRLPSVRRN